ncbi:M1 family metallopeptidase [Actinoplanes sp. NPDC020271]|uniref:M1 family metallopeptidase n=1 Tax=Actinoplanes sp. NPDC020271 TaxID=3363896 RepID=UPI00378FB99E
MKVLTVGVAAVLAMAGLTTPAHAAGSAPSPGSAGLGDRLYPLLGNGGYDVLDYDLHLRYPQKDPEQVVSGDVTITAVARQSLSRFNLDFGGGSAGRVSVDGRPAGSSRDGDELTVTPSRPLRPGRAFRVTVTGFTAAPARAGSGSPAGLVPTPDGTVLAGQPDSAHLVFPANDHPRDKATFTITLTAPAGWTGTAGGRLVSTTEHDGYVTSVYRESAPMATELVQLAVGDFVVERRAPVGGTAIRDVVPRRLAGTLLPAITGERRQLAWMAEQVGPYPFDGYGSLVIDDDLGYALETQTLSLYGAALFTGPEATRGPSMTHELAHQWFGDSVSPYSWSDVWLNEGHATWYEMLWSEQTGGFPQYTGLADREAFFKAVYAAGDIFRRRYGPVAAPLDATTSWDVFNPNVYAGGALVLYALQQKLGAARFQQVERAWVTAYRGRSASTRDFVTLASRVARQDLRPFLTAWLDGATTPPMPNHPDWTVAPPPVGVTARS